jgi:hypothetical protein
MIVSFNDGVNIWKYIISYLSQVIVLQLFRDVVWEVRTIEKIVLHIFRQQTYSTILSRSSKLFSVLGNREEHNLIGSGFLQTAREFPFAPLEP